jgi:hypothetical protein
MVSRTQFATRAAAAAPPNFVVQGAAPAANLRARPGPRSPEDLESLPTRASFLSTAHPLGAEEQPGQDQDGNHRHEDDHVPVVPTGRPLVTAPD